MDCIYKSTKFTKEIKLIGLKPYNQKQKFQNMQIW